MIHHLAPYQRSLLKSLGFVKGPKEPVRLDTFLTQFVDEVTEFNNGSGTAVTCLDGISRKSKFTELGWR